MTKMDSLDVVAFAAHPEDVELSCGGTIALLAALGYRVLLVDLTKGELGTNGSPDLRAQEASAAAQRLNVIGRQNLGLPDGGINSHDPRQLSSVVTCLRETKPRVVFVPYWEERHPDHVEASHLITRAAFFSNVGGYQTVAHNVRHDVKQIIYYQMRTEFAPSFIVDISGHVSTKMEAIKCFGSQVASGASESNQATLLNSARSLSAIEARDGHFGAMIGVAFGEAFYVRNALSVSDPVAFFNTESRPLFY